MKTDIEIAQSDELQPIVWTLLEKWFGWRGLELYRKYKAGEL